MDEMLITLTEARRALGFDGTNSELLKTEELIHFCVENQFILKSVKKSDLHSKLYEEKYYPFMLKAAWQHLIKLEHIEDADQLKSEPGYQKVSKVLWSHGVFGDLRDKLKEYKKEQATRHAVAEQPKLTLAELHEICQIYHGYEGSYSAFARHIQRTYGSFAEYCLQKGYDVNTTKWEDQDAAVRVAKKIGDPMKIKYKSPSLLKFLKDKGLLEKLFPNNETA
jgi:hypothetical protein